MDLAEFESAAFTFRIEGSAFASAATSGPLFFTGFDKKRYGLGGIRTRGLYVANVTIYP